MIILMIMMTKVARARRVCEQRANRGELLRADHSQRLGNSIEVKISCIKDHQGGRWGWCHLGEDGSRGLKPENARWQRSRGAFASVWHCVELCNIVTLGGTVWHCVELCGSMWQRRETPRKCHLAPYYVDISTWRLCLLLLLRLLCLLCAQQILVANLPPLFTIRGDEVTMTILVKKEVRAQLQAGRSRPFGGSGRVTAHKQAQFRILWGTAIVYSIS